MKNLTFILSLLAIIAMMPQPQSVFAQTTKNENAINFGAANIPQNYENILGPFLFEPFAVHLMQRIDMTKAYNVLELACGTGRVTKHLADRLQPSAHLTATDINPQMMSVAKQLIPSSKVSWEAVDMGNIPFPDGSFDLIVCQFGVMFATDKLQALTEMKRVLKKDGKLIFNTWGRLEENKAWHLLNKVLTSYLGDGVSTPGQGPFAMKDENAVLQLLKQAGFSKSTVVAESLTGKIENASLAAHGFLYGTPAVTAIKKKDPSLLTSVEAALEKEFSTQLGNNPMQSQLHAWVFEATK